MIDRADLTVDQSRALKRLVDLVAEADRPTYTTSGGTVRDKTLKQRGVENAVAREVVRFAFDHAGLTLGHLAPTGLYLDLLDEVRTTSD